MLQDRFAPRGERRCGAELQPQDLAPPWLLSAQLVAFSQCSIDWPDFPVATGGGRDETLCRRLSACICRQPGVRHRPLPLYPRQHQRSVCLLAQELPLPPEHPILSEMPSVPAPGSAGDVPLLCGMVPLPVVAALASEPGGTRAGWTVRGCSPSWVGVLATYSTFFMPLSNSLYSTEALRFFLWVRPLWSFCPSERVGGSAGSVELQTAFPGAPGAKAALA